MFLSIGVVAEGTIIAEPAACRGSRSQRYAPASNSAFPPAAAVLMVSVCSVQKRYR